ncbi:MAG: cohesin domain-containing protein, partial [Saprospiraceae bacterium]
MEKQTIWNMRNWMWFLAIYLSFSLQNIFAEPTPTYSLATCQPIGKVPPVVFTFNCIDGQPGDTICIPVTVTNFSQIVIAQFEIYWNSDVLDYIEIKNPGIAQINLNGDFNLSGPNALKFIPLNFDLFNGESLPDGSTIFEVCFRIIGTPGSTSNVGISPFFDFEVADINSVIPSDSINCNMTVSNA